MVYNYTTYWETFEQDIGPQITNIIDVLSKVRLSVDILSLNMSNIQTFRKPIKLWYTAVVFPRMAEKNKI